MFESLKRCFSINLNEYENIGVSLEINKVVFIFSFVLILGIIALDIYRGSIRKTVAQLIRHKAFDEKSSKTLSELGLGESAVIKKMLTRDNLLTKIVAKSGEKKYEYDEFKKLSKEEKAEILKIDFAKDSFYIREEKLDYAKKINEKYTTSVFRTVLSCVFVLIISMCLISCMPGILDFINNTIKS